MEDISIIVDLLEKRLMLNISDEYDDLRLKQSISAAYNNLTTSLNECYFKVLEATILGAEYSEEGFVLKL